MPRPSAWNSPTTAIRVPAHAVDAVMMLARKLDQEPQTGFVQNPDQPPPPYMVTVDNDAYICHPPTTTPEEDALIDQAMAKLDAIIAAKGLRAHDTYALLVADLAPRVGKKI